ncbi:MAG: BREX-1 system phosphatase PglZ type A [Gordonibacter sp.]|uniref:BREX-1 system phosphatase PglZ type A n=1 Tax=Gordonibacter sp. TaxID=1968902 RepID=UPI00321FFF94
MDIDIKEIEERIAAQVALCRGTVFWEDEPGDYMDVVGQICVDGGVIIDATRAELAAKRRILRGGETTRFIVYRAGGAPRPDDDFLYDIKMASKPFVCSMEGVWAAECGLDPKLTNTVMAYSKFFNSKDRKKRLSETALPKETPEELQLAMVAACVSSRASARNDAVRDSVTRLTSEHARGQEPTYALLLSTGLLPTFWSLVSDVVGYAAPDGTTPTLDDLAFRMLQTRCSNIMPDGASMLTADAIRILDDLASGTRTRPDYDSIVASSREALTSMVPVQDRTMNRLAEEDTLPDFDEWILTDMTNRSETGSLSVTDAESMKESRKHTLWFDRYKDCYECLASAARLREGVDLYESESIGATSLKALFDSYCERWFTIDAAYRTFSRFFRSLPNGRFKVSLSSLKASVQVRYDRYLMDLTDKWQFHLMDEGTYPPRDIPSQNSFFHDKIARELPSVEGGRRIGVIVSDAMRFEAGVELSSILNDLSLGRHGKTKSSVSGMTCMLPSYTQLGMAALLPPGEMSIDLSTGNVVKEGALTAGLVNRQAALSSSVKGALALKASDVLESGLPDISNAPLVFVYHNVIDKRGDSQETEGEVFSACKEAFEQVPLLVSALLGAGCRKVFVTADHGFLYQEQDVESFNYASVEGLHDLSALGNGVLYHTRRFAVGTSIPTSDMLVEYSAADLSLVGEYKVAFPKGISRLRLSGSGARYVHGGASLQENAVPVVAVEPIGRLSGVERTGAQGFIHGRPLISGPMITLDVYQTQACSEKVLPTTVKVGLYTNDDEGRVLSAFEKTLELSSDAPDSERRKTEVRLPVMNDIDDYDKAILRISARVGNTNQFAPEWEQELAVNRAFGNDFL